MKRLLVAPPQCGTSKRTAVCTIELVGCHGVVCQFRSITSEEELVSWLQERGCHQGREELAAYWRRGQQQQQQQQQQPEGGVKQEECEGVELRFTRADARLIEAVLVGLPGAAIPKQFLLMERDVTEKEQELATLTDFFDNGTLCLHLVGEDGTILRANQRELEFLGYNQTEYIGRSIVDFHTSRQAIDDILARLSRGERVVNYEAQLRHRDGTTRDVLINSSVRFSCDGRFMHTRCFTQDITEKKKLERELQRAREVAEEANRAKDRFLAVLSHELRTPLTPAVLILPTLENDSRLPQDVKAQLSLIQRGLQLETRLIDDLIDSTSIQRGELCLRPTRVDLHAMIRSCINLLRVELDRKAIHCEVELEHASFIWADETRLQQVFFNLLQGIIDSTKPPPTSRIRITSCDTSNGMLKIRVSSNATEAFVSAFKRSLNLITAFDISSSKSPSPYAPSSLDLLGLNLFISRSIVERHAGQMQVAVSDGEVCIVTIELPKGARNIDGNSTPALLTNTFLQQQHSISSRYKILFVEDNDVCRLVIGRSLRDTLGHEVYEVATLREAIQSVSERDFDLIISDIGLPDGDGHDLMTYINQLLQEKRMTQRPPAIALSGFGLEADIRKSIEAGFCRHLTKPVTREALEECIVEVMNKAAATTAAAAAAAAKEISGGYAS